MALIRKEKGSHRQDSVDQRRNLNPGRARLGILYYLVFLAGNSRRAGVAVGSPLSETGVGCFDGKDTHP